MISGETIRKRRKEKGLTQRELGKIIGVSQQRIAQYESRKENPCCEMILQVISVLDIPYPRFENLPGKYQWLNRLSEQQLEELHRYVEKHFA